MYSTLAKRNFRLLLILVFSTICVVTPFFFSRGSFSSAKNFQPQGDSSFIRQIPLRANDLVFSSSTQKIYASVPSSAGVGGNSITSLDPLTGTVDAPVFIGSEPNRLALADDGQTLWASLDGAATIRRFDIPSKTPGVEFLVGQDSFHGVFSTNDFAVAPGNPGLVAVARYYRGTSPPEAGVAVFDNGVQRPTATQGHIAASSMLAFSASASTLYGGGSFSGLNTMTINASGVSITGTTSFNPGTRIRFDNGRVYGSTGQVINPVTATLFGTFTGVGTGPFTTDSSVGRAYFITGSQSGSNYSITLRAFDLNTFLQVGSLTIPGINGEVSGLVRWGSNGLAFRTNGGQLFLIQTSLVPSADPIPTPTPTPLPTATPTPTPFTTFVKLVPLVSNDIAYSPSTQLVYASIPSSVGTGGNSIQPINPDTGALSPSVFIGSEPTRLAMSDDGQVMYVALDGAAAVRRFNVASQVPDLQFFVGLAGSSGPLFANDIAIMPGNSTTVAISRMNKVGSGSSDGVAIYEDGVRLANTTTNRTALSVEFSNTPDKLYTWSGNTSIDRLSANSSGVTFQSSFQSINGGDIRFDGGLIYTVNGNVIDPIAGSVKGTFNLGSFSFNSRIMTTDVPNNRAYFITTDSSSTTATLRAFDLTTLVPLGTATITLPSGSFNSFSRLVRWGTNGLAFRTASHLVLIQTVLVPGGGPVPTPTPTPSPTPFPTPTPTPSVPTFVRQLNLPVNDLVYASSSQKLYASVPSAAGLNGNSVTRIDPATGAVGPSVFIGSEPNKVALSVDETALHVSLDGAAAIRQFDIPGQTAGVQFPWGSVSSRPLEMAVVPGSPNALAIAGGSLGVSIYDSGVKRPNSSNGGSPGISALSFASPTLLYGYDGSSSDARLINFTVDANGVMGTPIASSLVNGFNAKIKFENGLIYSSAGRVVDPISRTIVGTFQNCTSNIFAVDTSIGRAFCLIGNGQSVTIRAFDTNNFLQIGSVTLQGIAGNPVRLVRWGSNGLAFNTTSSSNPSDPAFSKVYLLQSELVSNATQIPTGIQLSADRFTTFEGSSNFTITVTRSGNISGESTVNYATSNGTATAGSDYTETSGTLTFAPGQSSRTIQIPLLDDNVFEGPPETFNFTLSSPTGGSVELPGSAVVTINDSESRPSVFASTVNSTEGNAGTKVFSVPVTLTNASFETISISYATENGTATAGSDYVSTSGVVTFAPGTTMAAIEITVNGDTTPEGDETFVVRFTNPVNAFNSVGQLTLTIANDDSVVNFSSPTYSITESGPFLNVVVTRTGEVQDSVVDYMTTDTAGVSSCTVVNGVASSRCDYLTTLGTISFAAGEMSKTISIPIVDDVHVEGAETFTVALSNPFGMSLGPAATAVVTISDNDSSPGPNPIDSASFFVRQHYIDFLNREPDAGGLQFWSNEITSCGNDTQCIEGKRVNVSAAFFLSIEFQETGYFVYRVHKSAFGDLPGKPVPIGLTSFLKESQQIGQGVQVGIGNWQSQLEANKQLYLFAFVQRLDFRAAYPNTLTAQEFVDKMNANAGGILTPSQIVSFVNFLSSAPSSPQRRWQILRATADSAALRSAESNKAFVLMQYFGYLRRNPNDLPDTDFSGFNFWLGKLNSFGGNFQDAEMVKAFIVSIEYRQRFAP